MTDIPFVTATPLPVALGISALPYQNIGYAQIDV